MMKTTYAVVVSGALLLASCSQPAVNVPSPTETQASSTDQQVNITLNASLSAQSTLGEGAALVTINDVPMSFVQNQVIVTTDSRVKLDRWLAKVGGKIVSSPETVTERLRQTSVAMERGQKVTPKVPQLTGNSYLVEVPDSALRRPLTESAQALRARGFKGNLKTADARTAALLALQGETGVQVEPNLLASVQNATYAPYFFEGKTTEKYLATNSLWHLGSKGLNIQDAWARGYTGWGVTVSIIDTGWNNTNYYDPVNGWTLYMGPEMNGYDPVTHNWSPTVQGWQSSNYSRTQVFGEPGAKQYHGQLVTELAVGGANNSYGGAGVAPGANKIMAQVGWTSPNDGAMSLYDAARAVDGAVSSGARVINMSFGAPVMCGWEYPNTDLRASLRRAANANVIAVAGAGNFPAWRPKANSWGCTFGPYTVIPAGWSESVIAVGASTQTGDRQSESAYGDLVDVWAPGEKLATSRNPINSPCMQDGTYCVNDTSTVTDYFGLTSGAAPLVTGTVALMLQANPSLNKDRALRILKASSRSVGGSLNIVDTSAAVRLAASGAY